MTVCSFYYVFGIEGECEEDYMKVGRDCITGLLTRLCAFLRMVELLLPRGSEKGTSKVC